MLLLGKERSDTVSRLVLSCLSPQTPQRLHKPRGLQDAGVGRREKRCWLQTQGLPGELGREVACWVDSAPVLVPGQSAWTVSAHASEGPMVRMCQGPCRVTSQPDLNPPHPDPGSLQSVRKQAQRG